MPSPKLALMSLYFTVTAMGVNGLYSKVIPLNAVTTTELRCLVAAITLGLFSLLGRKSLRLSSWRQYGVVVGLGMLMAAHWSSFFHAMQASTVAIGILAHYSYPVVTVIVEPLINKRSPALSDVVAGLAVLAGVALMVPEWSWSSGALVGVLFGLISAITFGARNILQRRWLQDTSSKSTMFYQLLTVAVITAPFMDWQGIHALTIKGWCLVLLLGAISTALLHTVFVFSLRSLSAKSVSLVSCLQPPAAILFSWLLLGETPALNTILGGAVILTSALYESVKVGKKNSLPTD